MPVCLPSFAIAQDEQASEQQEIESNEVPEAPAKVDVQPVARDEQIAERLSDILVATKWFTDPKVKVQDGVVFLSGEAGRENYREFAGDLASKTQDVVAEGK